jgi:hypothetical protein
MTPDGQKAWRKKLPVHKQRENDVAIDCWRPICGVSHDVHLWTAAGNVNLLLDQLQYCPSRGAARTFLVSVVILHLPMLREGYLSLD